MANLQTAFRYNVDALDRRKLKLYRYIGNTRNRADY